MSYQLRPYQTDLLDRINAAWFSGSRSILAQLPTGAGKTVCFSHIVNQASKNGLKCLILAHREELIKQAADKVEIITDTPVGIIKAGYPANYDRDIQIASVQSLTRRLHHCPDFDLIVIDECHHSTSTSYRTILNRFPNARVLGVTATPIRLDGKGFRGIFDELICGVTVSELIESGSLSQYKYFATERSMSVDGVGKRQGDFKAEDVARANPVAGLAGDVVKSYRDYLDGKQAVIFCINIEHSIAICEHFKAAGIIAHHLDGNTPSSERSDVMTQFRDRQIQVLTNCALFDEGLDIPSLDGVILARPTQSLSRFLQMVGRALRPCEGKDRAIIIDLAGNYERLGMPDDVRVWTLDGIEKKQRGRSKLVRTRETGEVEEITIDLTPTGAQFREIGGVTNLSPELAGWFDFVDRLILTQQLNDVKPGWVAFRLMKSATKPPLAAWERVAQTLNYKRGWAKYKYAEWGESDRNTDNCENLTIDQLWNCVLNQLLPASRDLFTPYAELESITGNTVKIRMKSPVMRSIATGKIPELTKVFSQSLGQTIVIELTVKSREVSA